MSATRTRSALRVEIAELAARCVHCGFCLSACPTYAVTHEENDSPRGRILLLAREAERTGPVDPAVRTHIDRCIGCEACVPACPSGVRYDELLHRARELVEEGRGLWPTLWRRALGTLLPNARAMAPAIRASKVVARRLGSRRALIPGPLRRVLDQAQVSDPGPQAPPQPRFIPAARGTVALLAGCVAQAALPRTTEDALYVLEAEGWQVEVLSGVCCGALADHTGDPKAAHRQASSLLEAWEALEGAPPVVVTSAGCGAELRRYGELYPDDERARRVAERTKDVTQLLASNPPRADRGSLTLRVAVHDACHLRFAQGETLAPRLVLAQIPGIEVVEPSGSNCCGAGGLFSLLEPALAEEVGRAKRDAIAATGASVVASPNPGCTLQLRGLLGPTVEVVHPVSLLARSIEAARSAR